MVDLNPTNLEMEPSPSYDPMNDIAFLLFTRQNPLVAQRITFDMNTVRNSNWNPENGLRFILHGWNGNSQSAHNIFITRELLGIADHNVVVIDWSVGMYLKKKIIKTSLMTLILFAKAQPLRTTSPRDKESA